MATLVSLMERGTNEARSAESRPRVSLAAAACSAWTATELLPAQCLEKISSSPQDSWSADRRLLDSPYRNLRKSSLHYR